MPQKGDAVFCVDREGRILHANTAFSAMLGHSPSALLQLSIFDIVEDGGQKVRANLQRLFRTGASFAGQRLYRRADSTLIPVDVVVAALKMEGKHAAFAIVRESRTVPEDLRLQQALTHAAAQWRQTFDAIASPVLVLDGEMRIVRLNAAARDYLQSSFEALLNSRIPSSPELPWQEIEACVRQALVSQQAQGRRTCDSAQRQLQVTVTPGSGDNTVVLLHDVTDLHRLQESLRHSEIMSAMGLLVAGVAHEVRNPLFSISALTETFELRFGFTPEQAPYVARLRRELDRLNHLMSDLLAYGKTTVHDNAKQIADLAPLVHTALDISGPLLRERRTKVDFQFPASAPAKVDSACMVDAIRNVIENAAYHTPPAGEIEISLQKGPSVLALKVRDHGPGFTPEGLQRAFEPFYSKRSGGTGLGLPIVQRILLEHQGDAAIANHPDGGAVVTLTIPRVDT